MRQLTKEEPDRPNPEADPYSDPVLYLRRLGIDAELIETRDTNLPSAA
jgi:hypothetical protein